MGTVEPADNGNRHDSDQLEQSQRDVRAQVRQRRRRNRHVDRDVLQSGGSRELVQVDIGRVVVDSAAVAEIADGSIGARRQVVRIDAGHRHGPGVRRGDPESPRAPPQINGSAEDLIEITVGPDHDVAGLEHRRQIGCGAHDARTAAPRRGTGQRQLPGLHQLRRLADGQIGGIHAARRRSGEAGRDRELRGGDGRDKIETAVRPDDRVSGLQHGRQIDRRVDDRIHGRNAGMGPGGRAWQGDLRRSRELAHGDPQRRAVAVVHRIVQCQRRVGSDRIDAVSDAIGAGQDITRLQFGRELGPHPRHAGRVMRPERETGHRQRIQDLGLPAVLVGKRLLPQIVGGRDGRGSAEPGKRRREREQRIGIDELHHVLQAVGTGQKVAGRQVREEVRGGPRDLFRTVRPECGARQRHRIVVRLHAGQVAGRCAHRYAGKGARQRDGRAVDRNRRDLVIIAVGTGDNIVGGQDSIVIHTHGGDREAAGSPHGSARQDRQIGRQHAGRAGGGARESGGQGRQGDGHTVNRDAPHLVIFSVRADDKIARREEVVVIDVGAVDNAASISPLRRARQGIRRSRRDAGVTGRQRQLQAVGRNPVGSDLVNHSVRPDDRVSRGEVGIVVLSRAGDRSRLVGGKNRVDARNNAPNRFARQGLRALWKIGRGRNGVRIDRHRNGRQRIIRRDADDVGGAGEGRRDHRRHAGDGRHAQRQRLAVLGNRRDLIVLGRNVAVERIAVGPQQEISLLEVRQEIHVGRGHDCRSVRPERRTGQLERKCQCVLSRIDE